MLLICYPKCSTCKNVEKLMEEKNLTYEYRPIHEDVPTADELRDWHQRSGLPIKRFFNTSGRVYRDLGLKDKLDHMSDEDKYDLLATDGMLIKRPILIDEDRVLVGPDVKKFLEE